MPAASAFFPRNCTNYTNMFFFAPAAQRKTPIRPSLVRVLNADGFILTFIRLIYRLLHVSNVEERVQTFKNKF